MTDEQFKFQIQRLESTFGEKHFDIERLDLVKAQVMWMELGEFSQIVSNFISSFRAAPLPKDFKDAVLAYKRNRQTSPRTVPQVFKETVENSAGLRQELEKRGAKTLKEAIEIERLRLQVKNALSED